MARSRCSEPAGQVTLEGDIGSDHEMAFDLQAGVVLLLGEGEELDAECLRLVELAAGQVEAGEVAQHRQSSRKLPDLLGELERPAVRLLRPPVCSRGLPSSLGRGSCTR